jgi:hypothetical protein
MLDNGNILVVTGWVRMLIIGDEGYNNTITTYEKGIQMSRLFLKNDVIVKTERSKFDLSKCR